MQTYILEIVPRIQKFSQKLDDLSLLTNQHWVAIDNLGNTKIVYIFRQNNELLISNNGKVVKARWEYLGHNALLIDIQDESFLFRPLIFDENIIALKLDSKDEYACLVNETKFDKEFNSLSSVIEFLNSKYVEPSKKRRFTDATGIEIENGTTVQTLIAYSAPNYKLTKESEKRSIFYGMIEKFLVEFNDGISGEVYSVKKSKEAYYIAKPAEMWISVKFFYINLDRCIDAFHYYLTTQNQLKQGSIGAF